VGNDETLEGIKFRYFIILSLILHLSILFFFRPDFGQRPEGFRPTYVRIVEIPSTAHPIEKRVEVPRGPKSSGDKSKRSKLSITHEPLLPASKDTSEKLATNRSERIDRPETKSEVPSVEKKGLTGKGIRGLPLVTEGDLERLAKVERPALNKKEKGITLDTDELKYLSYLERLKNRIEFIWKYPERARLNRLEGDLYIRFSILKDGRLGRTELLRSSGYKILDDAALEALKDSEPFWPLPDSWDIQEFTITGHFIYYLGGLYLR